MKKMLLAILLGLPIFASAEIVTNSAGEKIDLKPNGTWVKVKKSPENIYMRDGESFIAKVLDGNDKYIDIRVHPTINNGSGRQLTIDEISARVKSVALIATIGLKNKYSFEPKIARVEQSGNNIVITVEYLAENSYGAKVVGQKVVGYFLSDNGDLKINTSTI